MPVLIIYCMNKFHFSSFISIEIHFASKDKCLCIAQLYISYILVSAANTRFFVVTSLFEHVRNQLKIYKRFSYFSFSINCFLAQHCRSSNWNYSKQPYETDTCYGTSKTLLFASFRGWLGLLLPHKCYFRRILISHVRKSCLGSHDKPICFLRQS